MARAGMAGRADTAAAGWRDVYDAWFPAGLEHADLEAQRRAVSRWFRGRADPALPGLAPLVAAARAGRLSHWTATPVGRLLLILLADPIARTLLAGRPEAFAGEALALRLAEEGLRSGHYEALARPWEKIFLILPLAGAEGPRHPARLERAAVLAERVVATVPGPQQPLYWFALGQIRAHQDQIARFGRFPHRNALLGRPSTRAELAYLHPAEFGGRTPAALPGWRLSRC
ncbi:DUF924 family protein [Inquilinus sp. OTU3971]|uniref:DUF924 family protein n=1 Tax=Inquilinus sp. OTU3971 TaxID=3043855 RepID=UPI00313B3E09